MSWDLIFREVQKFRQTWLWALLIPEALIITVIFGHAMLTQLVLGQPWGNRPMPNDMLIVFGLIVILLAVGIPLLFYFIKLVVEVRVNGIYIRFYPFINRKISFEEVKTFELKTYNPVTEYGGWGIRWSSKKGIAYIVSGNQGVQLELVNGKKLLIGSQYPEDLVQAIEIGMRKR